MKTEPTRKTLMVAVLLAALALVSHALLAADMTATVPSGSGFVILDSTGTQERLRVQESGAVSVPGLPTATQGNTLLCFDSATGSMGPCPSGQVRDQFFKGTSCTNPNNASDIMVKVGPLCVDKYEASVWQNADGTGTAYGALAGQTAYPGTFPADGNWTTKLYAASKAGVTPSTGLTWFQAQQACAASGKRLLTNAEWQMAAAGTPDPGLAGDGTTTCNTNTGGAVLTGSTGSDATGCISKWGVRDMVGNVWEWVADWMQGNTNPWAPSGGNTDATYGGDFMLGTNPAQFQGAVSNNLPSTLALGGNYSNGITAGVFALEGRIAPSYSGISLGFRCAQ